MNKFQKLMLFSAAILLSGNVAFCPPKRSKGSAPVTAVPETNSGSDEAVITAPDLGLVDGAVGSTVEGSSAGADASETSTERALVTSRGASASNADSTPIPAADAVPGLGSRTEIHASDSGLVDGAATKAPVATPPADGSDFVDAGSGDVSGIPGVGVSTPAPTPVTGVGADHASGSTDAPLTPPVTDEHSFLRKHKGKLAGVLVVAGGGLIVNNRFYAWQEKAYTEWRNAQELSLQVVLPETLAELEDSLDEGIYQLDGQYLSIAGMTVELPKFGRGQWLGSFFRKASKPVVETAPAA